MRPPEKRVWQLYDMLLGGGGSAELHVIELHVTCNGGEGGGVMSTSNRTTTIELNKLPYYKAKYRYRYRHTFSFFGPVSNRNALE